ncbi:TetR/AcrR family transcriptional regulator [Cohnella herbarum]|uniref:TetR/AcrR family transcriptional regulator n=1 Tax=Cohnella herbarum TaxID=2728023 RepID=A0A7Z2VHB5_9BACL|nr:TetR/AcrR family transcriptional regulator [Cohnella herbarum]QJD83064.1 TetR/AcrR family transcriptional regulator [Cohnella herbarum]
MNGFEKRASQIKHKIIQTTLQMLSSSGSSKIRIADLAKAANVSQVTIYNYFGSKEILIREAFIDYVDRAILEFEQYMDENHSLKEKIEHIILLEKSSYKELPPGLIKELLAADEELSRYIELQYKEKTIPLTVRILEEGKRSGEISEGVSIESVLAFIQLYMNQYETILQMAEQSEDMDKYLEGMVHMFFYGICGKP